MYHPLEEGGTSQGTETLEFIELYNNRAVFEDLSGYAFTDGFEYTFPAGTILGAKQYLVVARDPCAVKAAYGISGVYGPFTSGRLANEGEQIDLSNANGEIVISFEYGVDRPWPVSPDGTGHSLIRAKLGGDPDEASTWSPSAFIGGNPGGPDERVISPDDPALIPRVVINEWLANSDTDPCTDWLELYNPGPIAIDLTNVYLSDSRFNLLKYKIPDGTVRHPGQFWSVREGALPGELPFGLDFSGETIYVTEATNDPVSAPVRILDAVRFGYMEPDKTSGRFPDGSDYFGILSAATFDAANTPPEIGDLVINEIMYQHALRDDRYEYIELYNQGANPIPLGGWSITDGIRYGFDDGIEIGPGDYLVVARDPAFLATVYDHLTVGINLFGPYSGRLSNHSERIRLLKPVEDINPDTHLPETHLVIADEVTYYDGGRWPTWANGQGTSLELRDPHSNNDTPQAWADSHESSKTTWQQFSFTVDSSDPCYTHDWITVFGLMLLNRGEILVDDLELIVNGSSRLSNGSFEDGKSNWNILGNHVRSFVTTEDRHYGAKSLQLMATGHGDPGANRINQKFSGITAGTVTFRGWARWLRGSRFLLLRTSREMAWAQPPRPAHAFELNMPLDLGTPGLPNTALVSNRGPDILEVQHNPVLPAANETITVNARIIDPDPIGSVSLYYRSEGPPAFSYTPMLDNGLGNDAIEGDGIFTATIPPASAGTMRAFYIEASDGAAVTRFPTALPPTADVPDRTCLVRVADTAEPANTQLANYRIWLSNGVINAFLNRPGLANELMDCTFVYNNTEVFYNVHLRLRGSPFLRRDFGLDPRSRRAYRIEFNPDQRFGDREEINLDNTEGGNRGPLQERASYWFYAQMGLQYSSQEYVRPIINGNEYDSHKNYEDVQKVDGDYIDKWFPDDNEGYLHKIDDYFEYNLNGTEKSNLDEGLIYYPDDPHDHPLLKETYRWAFEKRSHRENDQWDHLFNFAVAMNTPSDDPDYETIIESVIDPSHFARVLALRHAVGDWDSYGYERGKNNYFYYALPEGKWYLLPWDIDFTLGSGHGSNMNLFSLTTDEFPEVNQFLNYSKYRRMYLQAFAELVNGSWQTSYGTANPPTPFDRFLDNAADVLAAEGWDAGRRNSIKQFVRDRRAYILTQIPSSVFEITTNSGADFCASTPTVILRGAAPLEVSGISVNGTPVPVVFTGNNAFEVEVEINPGPNLLNLQGLNGVSDPVAGAADSITVIRVPPTEIFSVKPNLVCNNTSVSLTLYGSGFVPGSSTSVALTIGSDEIGFDALYVQYSHSFDQIDEATLLLNDPGRGVGNPTYYVHPWINLWNPNSGHGEFTSDEQNFAPPFNTNSSNYAVRFTGFIYAPAPGIRYFGVNSDDGFSLWIDGQLVGEFANARAPATTDVTKNRTAGTMTFDFPAPGAYYLVLDFFENGGGEEIELFQTNASGGDQRLINRNAELIVYRNDVMSVDAMNVNIVDENTLTCQVDLNGAKLGVWNLTVTPDCGAAAQGDLDNALQTISPLSVPVDWSVLPAGPLLSAGPAGGAFVPAQLDFFVKNLGATTMPWAVTKDTPVNWLDLPATPFGSCGPLDTVPVSLTLNEAAADLPPGIYLCPLVFSVGCNPSGPSELQRQVRLTVRYRSDFNHDLHVDSLDLTDLTQKWGQPCTQPAWCDDIDLDRNGRVDLGDFTTLAREWLLSLD